MAHPKKRGSSSKPSFNLTNLKQARKAFCDSSFFVAYLRPIKEAERYKRAKEFTEQAKRLFLQMAKDKELSLCDVLSYIIVTDILGTNTPCLSFDNDFKSLGLLIIS